MSFLFTAPDAVTDAAGHTAGIGSTLTEARVAAAGPTTSPVAAAADEVSIALPQPFGAYGQQFQALSAEATTFHDEFVRLINGSAAAYLNAEIANAQGRLRGAVNPPAPTAAAAAGILDGLVPTNPGGLGPTTGGAPSGIFNGAGQQIGSVISSLISGNPGSMLQGLLAPNQTGGPVPGVGPVSSSVRQYLRQSEHHRRQLGCSPLPGTATSHQ